MIDDDDFLDQAIDIKECICGWIDLLGFGQPLMNSNWDLNQSLCKDQLKRISRLNMGLFGFYALTQGKSLTLNDGAIFNYDINTSNQHFFRDTVYFLDNLLQDYSMLNYRDTDGGYPGVRGIVTFGHRYHYTYASTTVSALSEDPISYHPKEFQMNTAFSKAYLMESSGSKAGIKGNHLYFDNHLLSSLEEFSKRYDDNNSYRINREETEGEMKYSVYYQDIRLLNLIFDITPIDFANYGIETVLYKFIKKESYQDDMAFEHQYRRSIALSQLDEDDDE